MVPDFQPTPISCYLESQLKCRMVISFQEKFLLQKKAHARVNIFLAVHHQELHLNNSDSFSSSDLLGMLENLNVEILPKFKNIFRTWI